MATDELSEYYSDLLNGSYDCVDRIVLNANFGLCYSAGGFRFWWRLLHNGSDEDLDNAHLMRMAGRFARRLRAYARAHRIPVMECGSEQRKHQIAERYLQEHPRARGLFLILVSRAMATVWEVQKSTQGVICNLEAKRAFINHYSFHLIDPDWGHVTIKMAGHPPFGAQVILNGHEYVACQARQQKIRFIKEGNCFHHHLQARRAGQSRRHLVRSPDCRALAPALRALDLQLLPMLRPKSGGAETYPIPLPLFDLSDRIQPICSAEQIGSYVPGQNMCRE